MSSPDPPRVSPVSAVTQSVYGGVRAATEFFRGAEASGVLLMAAAAAAMAWANLAGDSYQRLWDVVVTVGVVPLALSKPLLLWINDGLMAVFFFVVGLEIKREILRGELATARQAVLPVAAALGGMLAPAAIYGIVNAGGPGVRGWGIPMATDIAFALGVLALLGNRVAPSLRVFLTAVAIADDLGAVIVIAIFYTETITWIPLGLGALVLILLALMSRAGVARVAPYLVLGVALWLAVLKSGVHATIAGVLLSLFIPAEASPARAGGPSLLDRFEHALEPWVAYAILPVFALANAGVELTGSPGAALRDPIVLGIVAGLVVGKPLGVSVSCWLALRLDVASMPSGATWPQLFGVAVLCGIGFTMSLFLATLAFASPDRLAAAKIGILAGSFVAGCAGALVLARPSSRNRCR